MPPRDDLILFCDLETSGVVEGDDEIIEVGISLWSWPAWHEIGSFSSIVIPSRQARARMEAKDVVRNMHRENGLSAEIDGVLNDLAAIQSLLPEAVDEAIDDWLKPHGTSHIPLAGSGVSHFDRRFIKRFLPRFDRRITHWAYDVGVNRREYKLVGMEPAPDDGKTHRALDDARVHASEFAMYIEDLRLLKEIKAARNTGAMTTATAAALLP